MFRRMLTILLALVFVISMSACGDKENNDINEAEVSAEATTEESVSEEETTVDENSEETEGATAEVVLTGWEDLEFKFANAAFALPFEAGVLEANGWTLTGLEEEYDADYMLEAGTKVSNVYSISNSNYNSDVRTLVGFINNGKSAAAVKNCDVWSFVCNIYDETNGVLYENVPEIELANGITWGSTPDEIKAAYGESMKDIEGEADDYTVHMYMYNGLNIMKLTTRDNLGLVEVVFLSYTE